MYVGNITPYIPKSLENNQKVINSFKEVIESFDLEGMNGIDFMIKDNVPVILEINPRILGTFETIELSSKGNLVMSLIENKPVCPKTKYIKKILFAEQKLISNIKKQQNIFDIPKYGAIIEKNEPLTTVIGRDYGEINNAIGSISNMVIKYENR
jgi:predicted ATP-grasp superfamily ATP-dependent carboligase